MSLLSDYITGKTGFPIKHTGIGSQDWELQTWKRKEKKIIYKCSFCDCDILLDDYLSTHTSRDHTIARPKPDIFGGGVEHHYEVLGFICRKCDNEISEYDTLSYG